MTQADLAGREYTKSFISQLEGGYADPSLDTLRFLGRRLRLGLSAMAGDPEDQRLSLLAGLLGWAEAEARAGRAEAARGALALVRKVGADSGSDLYAVDALLLLAQIELDAGSLDRALSTLDDAARRGAAPGSRLAMRTSLLAGHLALRRGDLDAAASAFRRTLGQGRRAPRHPDLAVQALLGSAVAAARSGDRRTARRRLAAAAALAGRHRLDSWRARALVRLARLSWFEGRPAEALESLREAGPLATAAGDPEAAFETDASLGWLLLEVGNAPEALILLRRAAGLASSVRDRRARLNVFLALTRAALAVGDLDGAAGSAGDARALAGVTESPADAARAAGLTAQVLIAQGQAAEGAVLLNQALAALGDLPRPGEIAQTARVLADYYRIRGDVEGAAALTQTLSQAPAMAEEPWPLDLDR